MARKPSYNEISVEIPNSIFFNKIKYKVKPVVLKVPIKKQNNGGARITLSKDYADREAIVLIIEK